MEAGGEAGEGAHEGAVHACAFAQVDDDSGVGCVGDVFFDERFEGGAVEVRALAEHAHPQASFDTSGENP